MMTFICGTDRSDSNSSKVMDYCLGEAKKQGVSVEKFNLQQLPPEYFTASVYGTPSDKSQELIDQLIVPATHLYFIVPEYNGSYPGILKLFIDTVEPSIWKGKKAALTGLASGRSGNQRGLDHMVAVLHYLGVEVFSQKPLLSSIHQNMNGGVISNEEYRELIAGQIEGFRGF